jgi:chemotaxis protein CheD
VYIPPGTIVFPAHPIIIKSVVTFGLVITVHNPKEKWGAFAHFLYPYRTGSHCDNSFYAAPALYALWKKITTKTTAYSQLEVQVIGAASPSLADNFAKEQSLQNIKVCKELLQCKGFVINSEDTGGYRGRKILFKPNTGETIIARLDHTRVNDWHTTGNAANFR